MKTFFEGRLAIDSLAYNGLARSGHYVSTEVKPDLKLIFVPFPILLLSSYFFYLIREGDLEVNLLHSQINICHSLVAGCSWKLIGVVDCKGKLAELHIKSRKKKRKTAIAQRQMHDCPSFRCPQREAHMDSSHFD